MRYPGHDAHRAIVEALVREAPALIVNTGDLTDLGSEESNWQKYFEITAPMGAISPVVPALGNHDGERRGTGAALTWSLFGVPAKGPPGWTSLDLGGVHFVILSTNEMRNPAQVAWLRDDLAAARRHHARAIFAFCHEGPWSHGVHGGASDDGARLRAAAGGGARRRALLGPRPHLRARDRDHARGEPDLRRHRRRRRAALQSLLPGGQWTAARSCLIRCRLAPPASRS